jgi:hypothetical protein
MSNVTPPPGPGAAHLAGRSLLRVAGVVTRPAMA